MIKKICLALLLIVSIVLFSGCGVSQEEYNNLMIEKHDLEQELEIANNIISSLNEEIESANSTITNLEIVLTQTKNELDEIKTKYPLKYFEDLETLNAWIKNHTKDVTYDKVQSYRDALDIQKQAALDGYIISVEVNQNWWARLTTLIGINLYEWLPEDTESTFWEVLKW